MDRQASKMLIGSFVVGAVVLAVAGVLMFGGGQFMKKTEKYVLFFQGSVKGLNEGASVLFRGVKIGSVKSISLEADTTDMVMYIPVIIEVEVNRIHVIRGNREENTSTSLPMLFEKGLRAQLTMSSLLTGQLLIELEFHPDAPLKFVGLEKKYPEIPTLPSTFEMIFDKLKDLDFGSIVEKLLSAVDALEKVLASPDIPKTLSALKTTVEDADKLVRKLDSRVDPMFNGIDDAVKEYGDLARHVDKKVDPLASNMNATLKGAQKLVMKADGTVESLGVILEESLKEAKLALEQGEQALMAVKGTVAKDSPVMYQLDNTLKEISGMARAFRSLASFLERHPEALLRGKGSPQRR
jgi:paraquat-inducible protein B